MKQSILIFSMFISIVVNGQNSIQPQKETIDALQKVSFLIGTWKGTGWIQMGPQKSFFNQTESIALKVNGTLIQIDGLGRDKEDSNKIIHQAFAIISYDLQNSKYLMKAFTGNGNQIDADVKLINDSTFEWSFSIPMTGQIRYTISVKDKKWSESGEMSRDKGNTWNKFFEMTLDKI